MSESLILESYYGHYPKCPYCGALERDVWELGMNDEDVLTFKCGECGRLYIVSLSISYTYQSSKPTPRRDKKRVKSHA